MRKYLRRNGLALVGFAFVTTFVAVRAVGFHHFDVLINSRLLDIRFNVLFELSGLVLLAVNATALLGPGLSDAPSGSSDRLGLPETEGDQQEDCNQPRGSRCRDSVSDRSKRDRSSSPIAML